MVYRKQNKIVNMVYRKQSFLFLWLNTNQYGKKAKVQNGKILNIDS